MARFMGSVQGGRGAASRLGTPSSGIGAGAQGWNSGVRIHGYVDDDGEDAFRVIATGGSTGAISERFLGTVKLIDGRLAFVQEPSDHAHQRLAYLREQIEAECISLGELVELQELTEYIDPSDTLLLQWAGVPEF